MTESTECNESKCYFCDGLGILDDSTQCDNCAGTGEDLSDV